MSDRTQTTQKIHRATEMLASRSERPRRREARPRATIRSPEATSRDLSTGLPNRWTLQKQLGKQAWKAHRSGELLILVVVRVDAGDPASTPGGPDPRDENLRELGRRITAYIGSRDFLGRWEADRLLLISRPRNRRRGRELIRKIGQFADDLDLPIALGIASNEEVHDPPGLVRRAERDLDPPAHPAPETDRGFFGGTDLDERLGVA
ncbi:MAG: diguanylate cyclase [Thermoanaerobaculia bacterium]|nr:diguanylate cyclase [Thermoanaerobaculia bacterium]